METSDEAFKLISDIETERGGRIEWKTAVLFYADSSGNKKDTLLLYKIGDTFWFEDFEKESTFLGFKVPRPKNYKYEKFEGSFKVSDVVKINKVKKSDASAFCEGRRVKIKPAKAVAVFFCRTVTRIELSDGKSIFMEILGNDFVKIAQSKK